MIRTLISTAVELAILGGIAAAFFWLGVRYQRWRGK